MSISYYKNQLITNLADSTKINYKAYYNNYILFGADADTGDTPTDYSEQYFTFVAKSSGIFKFSGTSTTNTISYSTNSGSTWSTPSSSVTINVNSGDTVMWKGNMTPTSSGIGNFSGGTASFDAEGNIMSLLYGDNFIGETSLSGKNYAFSNLFKGTKVVNAENLILPTTLANYCYRDMFRDCTSLTATPQLPSTTLANYCYQRMFQGCSNLVTAPILPATIMTSYCYANMFNACGKLTPAPELPATTLASYCYGGMFAFCSALTQAPILSATTLATYCYESMFYGCSNLNYIKMLATDISANNCLMNWTYNVKSVGTFVKAASMTSLPSGTSGIPRNWTVENA